MVRRIPDVADLVALMAAAIFAGHGAVAASNSLPLQFPTEAAERTADLAEIAAMVGEAEANLVEIERRVRAVDPAPTPD